MQDTIRQWSDMEDERFQSDLEDIAFLEGVRQWWHRGVYAEERCNGRNHIDIGGEG